MTIPTPLTPGESYRGIVIGDTALAWWWEEADRLLGLVVASLTEERSEDDLGYSTALSIPLVCYPRKRNASSRLSPLYLIVQLQLSGRLHSCSTTTARLGDTLKTYL